MGVSCFGIDEIVEPVAIFGGANSQIATLVERQIRHVMLVKVAGKDTQTVVDALVSDSAVAPLANASPVAAAYAHVPSAPWASSSRVRSSVETSALRYPCSPSNCTCSACSSGPPGVLPRRPKYP